ATCPGCNNPVCLVFETESLSLLSGGAVSIGFGGYGTEWLNINDPNNSIGCLLVDPARTSTWGQVKSLYRQLRRQPMRLVTPVLCLCMVALAAPASAQGQLFLNFNDCNDTNVNKDLNCSSTTATTTVFVTAFVATAVSGVIADLGYIDAVVGNDP